MGLKVQAVITRQTPHLRQQQHHDALSTAGLPHATLTPAFCFSHFPPTPPPNCSLPDYPHFCFSQGAFITKSKHTPRAKVSDSPMCEQTLRLPQTSGQLSHRDHSSFTNPPAQLFLLSQPALTTRPHAAFPPLAQKGPFKSSPAPPLTPHSPRVTF